MNKINGVLVGLFLIIFGGMLIKDVVNPPKITRIEIPKFNGQILPAQEVNHQVFYIQKNFSEIGNWGEKAILTFGMDESEGYRHYERFVFEAWRPDPQIPNIFQYASKKIDLLNWTVPSITYPTAEVSKKVNTIYVMPKRSSLRFTFLIVLLSIMVFFAYILKFK